MIEGKEFTINKVFCNDFVFNIPLYQRPYAWTKEEAGALLSDIIDYINDGDKKIEEMNEYFIGSVVLIKGNSQNYEVIDGQQRLTTLTILLAVLRNLVSEEMGKGIYDFICEKKNPTVVGSEDRFRLTLRERDANFFREYVQKEDGISKLLSLESSTLTDESKLNIYENAKYIYNQLHDQEQPALDKLTQFIINRCYLVLVWTQDMQSAYRIFSVLNDRGLDLLYTDILKSEIIGNISEDLQANYTKNWEDIEESLGRDSFAELFAHIRTIFMKEKVRKSILEEIRSKIKPSQNPKEFIDNILTPYSNAYETIRNASYQSSENAELINQYLIWLKRIDNFDWIPPTILYFSRYNNDHKLILSFVRNLERLAACLMILRANVNERIKRYGSLIASIEKGEDINSTTSPLQLTVDEKSNIVSLLDGDVYLMKKIRMYILLRLDSALSEGSAKYEYPTITVEHVLPQNPEESSEWFQWFEGQEMHDAWVHRLANLVLLARRKNSQAQNYEFKRKKGLYFAIGTGVSSFAITTKVLQEEKWTPEVLENKQDEYLNKLKEIWLLG